MNPSRDKGSRLERLIVGIFDAAGIEAHRIPLSGAVDGFAGDVRLKVNGRVLTGEAKSRGGRFGSFYRWLEGNDFLAIKQDRCEALIVMEARKLAALLGQMPHSDLAKPASKPPDNPSPDSHPDLNETTSIPFETVEPQAVLFKAGKPTVRV